MQHEQERNEHDNQLITMMHNLSVEVRSMNNYYEPYLEQMDNKRFGNIRSIKGVTETLFNKIMPGCDGDKIEALEMSGN
jgi:hypothetical protein